MIGTIYITGEIGVDVTLLDVIKQVKQQSAAESFLVKIDSVGGYVDCGNDIYNYLKNLDVPVTTYTTKAYSIASVIFMAGETRVIPEGAIDALMIHLPWMEAAGNHSELTDYLKELKNTEDSLVKFYSDALGLDNTTIHSLLKSETYLNATQAKDLGFATMLQVPQKAIARLQNNEIKEENLMNKLNRKIDSIMNMLSGKIKAELKLQDAVGVELVFADLDATSVASVDAKVMVDGKPAEGEFLMADGSTIKVEKGIVTQILVMEAEVPVDAPVDVTNEAVAIEVDEVEVQNVDVDDAIIVELSNKVIELQAIIDSLMSAEQSGTMLDALAQSIEKQTELEVKFLALAKSIGSDFSAETKENKVNVKASLDKTSRAFQILNS
jgi:ATP-dependent protease ClpP protease subunit